MAGPRPMLVLHYDYVEDVLERRAPFRAAHLEAAQRECDAGRLVFGGAVGDPPHGGMLVFEGVTHEDVEAFAQDDPYVRNGIVTGWRIEPWTVVVSGATS